MWWTVVGIALAGKRAEWWYTEPELAVDGALVVAVDPVTRADWAKVAVRLESPSARWAIHDLDAVRGIFGDQEHRPRDLERGRWLMVPPGGRERITALFEGSPPGPNGWLVDAWSLQLAPVLRLETDGPALPLPPLALSGEPGSGGGATCRVVSAANGRAVDYAGSALVLIVTTSVQSDVKLACTNDGADWLMLRPLRARLGDAIATGGPLAPIPPGMTVVVPVRFATAIGTEGHLTVDGVVVRPAQQAVSVPPLPFARVDGGVRE